MSPPCTPLPPALLKTLQDVFISLCVNDDATIETMAKVYRETGYALCPHSAVVVYALEQALSRLHTGTHGYTRLHTVTYGHIRSHTVTHGHTRSHTVTQGTRTGTPAPSSAVTPRTPSHARTHAPQVEAQLPVAPTICVLTAHPAKFNDAVTRAGMPLQSTPAVDALRTLPHHFEWLRAPQPPCSSDEKKRAWAREIKAAVMRANPTVSPPSRL